MRVLLVSDTHEGLGGLDGLIEVTGADAVVHAGDLGFYDRESVERLADRELRLRVIHSNLPAEERRKARELSGGALREFVRRELPMSDLHLYLEGERRLRVPVYAVWGNHEDLAVIERFRSGEYRIENLHILDEAHAYRVGDLDLFGLGGNVLVGKKFFQAGPGGGGGKVWGTLSQFGALWEHARARPDGALARVLVTHVSPGKEPLVARLAAHIAADLVVSGHMGPPYCCVWNDFAVRTQEASLARLEASAQQLRVAWEDARRGRGRLDEEGARRADAGLRLLESLPAASRRDGRRGHEPAWYRGSFYVNLPDLGQGHAVLVQESGRLALETSSRGIELGSGRRRRGRRGGDDGGR